MKFILEDEESRSFIVERFCFRGLIDDRIFVGEAASRDEALDGFATYLGQESFYEL